jgi:hypothetical protein
MAMALMLFQQLSGINAVIFNLQTVFNSAGTSDEPAGISSFAVCAVQVVLYNDKKANVCDNHLFQIAKQTKSISLTWKAIQESNHVLRNIIRNILVFSSPHVPSFDRGSLDQI